MKNKLQKIGAVVAASFALLLTARAATSGSYLEYFSCTNVLSNSVTVTGFPTNQIGTNGVYPGTGLGGQYVGYSDHYAINVQGFLVTTNTNTTTIGIYLMPSYANASPTVTTGVSNALSGGSTNVMTQCDWVSPNTNQGTFWLTFQSQTNALNGTYTTNWINLSTNVVATGVYGDASFLGIYQITNNLTALGIITNFTVSVAQKLTVKPFSP